MGRPEIKGVRRTYALIIVRFCNRCVIDDMEGNLRGACLAYLDGLPPEFRAAVQAAHSLVGEAASGELLRGAVDAWWEKSGRGIPGLMKAALAGA